MQINSAWGQWSKEVEKTCREIQGLCSPLISPLYFCIVAKAFWTHSTVGRNNNTTVECFIYRLSKRQNKGGKNWNLYDERSPNKQTQKKQKKKKKRVTHFISSSYVFSSSHLPTLPPAENGAVGKIFFRAGGNTLWQCNLTHTQAVHWQRLTASSCELPVAIWTKDMPEFPPTTESVPAWLWPLQHYTDAGHSKHFFCTCVYPCLHAHLCNTANFCSKQHRDLKMFLIPVTDMT